jgi:hypothetical protein
MSILQVVFLLPLSSVIGFVLHEMSHYRSADTWDENPTFRYWMRIIPGSVYLSTPDDFPRWGIRVTFFAPTLTYLPLLLISVVLMGIPPFPLLTGEDAAIAEILRLSFLLMLAVAALPSPTDLFGLLYPEEVRKIAGEGRLFSETEALLRLTGVK